MDFKIELKLIISEEGKERVYEELCNGKIDAEGWYGTVEVDNAPKKCQP